jgi:hypothetical protein
MNDTNDYMEITFNDNDIKSFEKLYNKKALTKKKKPTKSFIVYLTKDKSHSVNKTIVSLEKDVSTGKIVNKSYEKSLTYSEFEKEISKLIKKAQNLDLDDLEKEKIQDEIKQLLKDDSKNKVFTMNTNVESNDVNAQDLLVDTSENYLGFIYFFWSADTMNFKIIGLHSINPLFEFTNVKQTFYLIKPAMITCDKPIYFVFDKIPYSIDFNIKDDMIILTNEFIQKGQTSDIFYFMEKNKTFIRVYGFYKLPLSIYIMILLVIGFICMLEYLIIMTILGIG